jgi:xylulose-5-phosphate/fructose-6-phosphate phosphoketolase
MVVLNDMDRFHLVEAVIAQLPQLGARAAYFHQAVEEKLLEHKHYIREHGDDMPEIAGWRWSSRDGAAAASGASRTSTEGDNV